MLSSVVFQKFDTELGCHSGHPGGAGGSIPLHPYSHWGEVTTERKALGLFNELRDYSPVLPLRIGPKSNRDIFCFLIETRLREYEVFIGRFFFAQVYCQIVV
jgi:hypothetical protein